MTNQIDFMLELRAKSTNDLMKLSEEKRAELFALKFQAAVGSLEQTHKLKSLKKDIARIELLVSERQKAGEIKKIKPIKTNYSKAVKAADKEGQIVRKKQIEQVQQMQQEQMGMGPSTNMDDFTAAMMAGAGMEVPKAVEPVVKKSEVKAEAKPATKKADAKPAVVKEPAKKADAKPAAKPATKKAEAKPAVVKAPAKKAEAKPTVVKALAKKAEAKPAAKTATKKAEAKPAVVKAPAKKADAKPAVVKEPAKKADAKPAAKKADAKPAAKKVEAPVQTKNKKISEMDIPYEDNFKAINVDLPKKPKEAKTYVFGSNKKLLDKELKEANDNSKKK